jgi:hypothetical protein
MCDDISSDCRAPSASDMRVRHGRLIRLFRIRSSAANADATSCTSLTHALEHATIHGPHGPLHNTIHDAPNPRYE